MRRRSLRVNIAANILGRGYTAIVGIIFVPIYLHFLGVAGYGLFALLNSYMVIASLLDLGFSGALTRELAKVSTTTPDKLRDVVWTISLPYCTATVLAAAAIYFAAPWIAAIAISKGAGAVDPAVIDAVGFAGLGLAFQLPIFLYTGALAGLQRQDIANSVSILSTTLRHGVAFFLLWRVSTSVATVMAWQAVIAVLTALATSTMLWRQMPSSGHRPQFRGLYLRETWRFAAGLGVLTVLGIITLQSDKVIVGALLPLSEVGQYMVAATIASNLLIVAQPVAIAAFPRLAQLIAMRDWTMAHATFEKLHQLVLLMVLPLAATIAVFPEEALMVWTGNATVAQGAAPYLRVLALGIGCNAFAAIPYGLILATGRTGFVVALAMALSVITVTAVYLGTIKFGALGAAVAIAAYLGASLLCAALVLRFFLSRREWWRWISGGVAIPLLAVAVIVGVTLAFAPRPEDRLSLLALLMLTWLATAAAIGWAMPWTRDQALLQWQQLRERAFGSNSEKSPP